MTQSDFEKRYDQMFGKQTEAKSDTYRIVVIIDKQKDRVVGTATLVIEKKFIRQIGTVS